MKTLKINRKISSTHLQIDELEKWVGKEVDIIIKVKESGVAYHNPKMLRVYYQLLKTMI